MANLDMLNRFAVNPTSLDISRSRFARPFTHKTTFKSGKLFPIYLDEVLPGDTFEIDTSAVVRMVTPAVPVMDNSFLDLYFFFVPFRLCTKTPTDWQKICGENFDGFWANNAEFTLQNTGNSGDLEEIDIEPQSLAHYFGFRCGYYGSDFRNFNFSLLPFRGYVKIWNDWFRDQNTQAPVDFDSDKYAYMFNEQDLLSVNKFHDYFTSALQAPQKGDSVKIPLVGMAPVITQDEHVEGLSNVPLNLQPNTGDSLTGPHNLAVSSSGNVGAFNGTPGSLVKNLVPTNLYANLGSVTATDINQIRQAFAVQRMLEKDARGGTRYIEVLKSYYGVTIPDNVLQRPEYLGGKRIPLNITQVLQQSGSASESSLPLGTTGAFSNTSFTDNSFIKSFNEYGYVIGVACVRTSQSYSQGIPKLFTRNRRFDFYWPVFANLGEQPIFNYELYTKGTYDESQQVFGYQEAWAEYRYHPNQVSGYLAPDSNDEILTKWTYTNHFSAQPVLNSSFMVQHASNIDDTLTVADGVYQFIADFYFDVKCTRPMPLYSIPGLVDHN